MDEYLLLPDDEKKLLCDQFAFKLGVPPYAIEKDYWVCWTLRELFSIPEAVNKLAFKGGTSLSKGYDIIKRFSEDIDIVIDRQCLGLLEEDQLTSSDGSKKRRQKLSKLKTASKEFTKSVLQSGLKKQYAERCPRGDENVFTYQENDDDNWEIRFKFPSVFTNYGNLSSYIKIEPGSRSDTDPLDERQIAPYLHLPNTTGQKSEFSIRTVSPKRTFWEKAMLLHEKATPSLEGNVNINRLSRHYYDVWCLWNDGIGKDAVRDESLFGRIAAHRILYFQPKKAARDTMKRGSFKLTPDHDMIAAWKDDYHKMSEMFFGDSPSFDSLMTTAREIQDAINSNTILV